MIPRFFINADGGCAGFIKTSEGIHVVLWDVHTLSMTIDGLVELKIAKSLIRGFASAKSFSECSEFNFLHQARKLAGWNERMDLLIQSAEDRQEEFLLINSNNDPWEYRGHISW